MRPLLSLVVALVAFFGIVLIGKFSDYDDSDSPPKRSGLVIHRDGLTGCEYFTRPGLFSFVTGYALQPRMGADGKQVCRKDGVR